MDFDATQIAAIDAACSNRFCMITGGAGTGKTTIIQAIADRLEEADEPYNLCAFAGKAAARLTQATGKTASTIHRMLRYNGTRFLAGTIGAAVIVDESSMIDSDLMAEIIKRRPTRLILVGDQAQLPPVGKGQPFHDLLRIMPEAVSNLTTCYRNSEAVYQAASAIRAGVMPPVTARSDGEKWDFVNTGSADAAHATILAYVRSGHIDFDRDIILCPRNGDNEDMPCTVKALNRDIVDIVNPHEDDAPIHAGDRVICTKNYPEDDIWNGTTATVTTIDSGGCPWIRLDTPRADGSSDMLLTKAQAKTLQLAYALTVHKAQGSQYRRVVFAALLRDTHSLLDRSLIYTAVTRTQEQCVVVGQYAAMQQGIGMINSKRTVIQEIAGRGAA